MKKRTLLILIVAAIFLLLAFGIWYFLILKKDSNFKIVRDDQSLGSANLSLKDLITRGTSQVCTFSEEDASGTIYVNGSRFREDVDVKSDEEDKTTKMYVMVMDGAIYIWNDGEKEGATRSFDMETITGSDSESPNAGSSGDFDTETVMNYNCRPWAYEANKFELPKDVKFILSEVPEETEESDEIQNSTQCSYCNKLSGDDQTQCLSALKCN